MTIDISCDRCNESFTNTDSLNECTNCGVDICDDCSYTCENCCNLFCNNCSFYDDNIDEWYCDDCYSERDGGDDSPSRPYTDRLEKVPAEQKENVFTFGLEIEVDDDSARLGVLKECPLFVAWHHDVSLRGNNLEFNTDALTSDRQLKTLTDAIAAAGYYEAGNAGGHIHVRRTDRQTPSRWYWALRGLDKPQTVALNMRHLDNSRWCHLVHGEYYGKSTAVNGDHSQTIELRTFGAWTSENTQKMRDAIKWLRHMWQYLQAHEVGSVSADAISIEAQLFAREILEDTVSYAARRCTAYRRDHLITALALHDYASYEDSERAARKRHEAAEMRARVMNNVQKSRIARRSRSEWGRLAAKNDWARHNSEREGRREDMKHVYSNIGDAVRKALDVTEEFAAQGVNGVHVTLQDCEEAAHGIVFRSNSTRVWYAPRDGEPTLVYYHRLTEVAGRRLYARLRAEGKTATALDVMTPEQMRRALSRIARH